METSSPLLIRGGWEPDSILILKPSSLGDVVHTLPAVAALKRHWPRSSVRWLVNPEWSPLLQDNPFVEHISIFPRQSFRGPLGIPRLLAWARHFSKTASADLVLDFQCLLRSAFIGRLCRRSLFFGLSDAREGAALFYDATARVTKSQHAVDRYLALVRALDVPVPEQLEWPLPASTVPAGFDSNTPFIAIHPFSRGNGKSLSINSLRILCTALAPKRIVLLGRSDVMPAPMAHVENWLNRTSLPELTGILARARWNVSVDSGPMHIAAALSERVLALHTWSDPARVGPYPPGAWVWKNGLIFQRGNAKNTLPASNLADVAAWLHSILP